MSPIFIGGCPRSGTTMLASMLGCASDTIVTPESHFKEQLLNNNNKNTCSEDKNDWELHANFRVWLQDEEFRKNWKHFSNKNLIGADGMLELVRLYGLSNNTSFTWIDHTPANILMIDKLAAVFPDARFIHIIRDGRAVLRSVIPLPWGPNTFYYGSQWWTSYVCAGLSAQSMNSISVTKVHYEDLVTDPESTLRDLCNDIGLKYQPEMPSGGGFKIPPYTRFQHKLVNRPVVNKLEQMGNELSSRDDEVFESVAGPIVRYLGYKTVFEDPRYPKFQERFFNGILEFARRVLNRVRQRARIRSLPK